LARKSRNRSRSGGLRDLAARLMGAGMLMLMLPVVFGKLLGGAAGALGPLVDLGLLLLLGGGLLLWLGSDHPPSAEPAAPSRRAPAPVSARAASFNPAPASVTVPDVAQALHATPPATPSAAPARPITWGPAVFDVIEWRRFEAVVEALFAQAGFETKAQSHGADGGVDVWLFSRNQPGLAVSVVQCKHWQGRKVGVDKIRELRGVMAAHNVRRGQFATTSTFTADAIAFGRENGINLLDVSGLLALIAQRTHVQQQIGRAHV
jgi:restriction system protein